MSTLARDLRRLASQLWLECQDRPLCLDEERDLQKALLDIEHALISDDYREKAA